MTLRDANERARGATYCLLIVSFLRSGHETFMLCAQALGGNKLICLEKASSITGGTGPRRSYQACDVERVGNAVRRSCILDGAPRRDVTTQRGLVS